MSSGPSYSSIDDVPSPRSLQSRAGGSRWSGVARAPDLADEIFGSLQSNSVFLGLDGKQLSLLSEAKTTEEPRIDRRNSYLKAPVTPKNQAPEIVVTEPEPVKTTLGFTVAPLSSSPPTYDDRPVGGKKSGVASLTVPGTSAPPPMLSNAYDDRPVGAGSKKAGTITDPFGPGSPSSQGPGPKSKKGVKMTV